MHINLHTDLHMDFIPHELAGHIKPVKNQLQKYEMPKDAEYQTVKKIKTRANSVPEPTKCQMRIAFFKNPADLIHIYIVYMLILLFSIRI